MRIRPPQELVRHYRITLEEAKEIVKYLSKPKKLGAEDLANWIYENLTEYDGQFLTNDQLQKAIKNKGVVVSKHKIGRAMAIFSESEIRRIKGVPTRGYIMTLQ